MRRCSRSTRPMNSSSTPRRAGERRIPMRPRRVAAASRRSGKASLATASPLTRPTLTCWREFAAAATTGSSAAGHSRGRASAGRPRVQRLRRAELVASGVVRILGGDRRRSTRTRCTSTTATPTTRRRMRSPMSAPDSSRWPGRGPSPNSFASTTSPAENYSGTVIVGDTNGRFFEPSAERNFLVGVTANVGF